jgi:cell division topological specificity factor
MIMASIFDRIFAKKNHGSNTKAKERLQIILAHERNENDLTPSPDYLPQLKDELIKVISKYVNVSPENIKVQLDNEHNMAILDVNIILNDPSKP